MLKGNIYDRESSSRHADYSFLGHKRDATSAHQPLLFSAVEISTRRWRGAVSAIPKISVRPSTAVKLRVRCTVLTTAFSNLWFVEVFVVSVVFLGCI